MRILVFVLGALGHVLGQTALVTVSAPTLLERARLQALDLDWCSCCGGATASGNVDILLHSQADHDALRNAGFSPHVVSRDVEAFYRSRLETFSKDGTPVFGQGSMGGYFTYDETIQFMDALAQQYPNIVAPKTSLGLSLEGRDLWMWKISDNPLIDEDEPEVLIDALHHAREVGTIKSALHVARTLCFGYGTDASLTELVNRREIFIVPVVNPDGLVYNETTNPGGGGLWRKNRRPNAGGSFGVDLNRNYGFNWGFDANGSSPSPTSETYRGTAPFSEPEAVAMKTFAEGRQLRVGHTMHSYGELVCLPPSHDLNVYAPEPYRTRLDHLAQGFTAESPGYSVGPTWQVLYRINGGSHDWQYGSLYGGLQVFSALTEQGTSSDGFWPATSRILPLAQEGAAYALFLARRAGVDLTILSTSVAEPGGQSPGTWEIGETLEIAANVRNDGLSTESVVLDVTSSSPWVQIVNGTTSLGMVNGSGGLSAPPVVPLSFQIINGTPIGTMVELTIRASSPSAVPVLVTLSSAVGLTPATPLVDDFETDQGWTVGWPGDNATAGIWTRADPNGTFTQGLPLNPEDDHTSNPGTLCWFTGQGPPQGAAGTEDVDGITSLVSPLFDLSNIESPVLSYWRWFATTGTNDTLDAFLSNDGGNSWVLLETLTTSARPWTLATFALDTHLPRTSSMRLRFRAADFPNDTLCEAALDDLRIEGFDPVLRLSASGTAAPGTTVSLTLLSPSNPQRTYILGASQSASFGIAVPGGLVPLDIDALFTAVPSLPQIFSGFVGTLDAGGLATASLNVPPLPSLSGFSLFVAGVALNGPSIVGISGAHHLVIP